MSAFAASKYSTLWPAAVAALENALKYSQKTLNLSQLYAVVNIENEESLRLFESVGFQKTAMLKKWLRVGEDYRDAALLQFFL